MNLFIEKPVELVAACAGRDLVTVRGLVTDYVGEAALQFALGEHLARALEEESVNLMGAEEYFYYLAQSAKWTAKDRAKLGWLQGQLQTVKDLLFEGTRTLMLNRSVDQRVEFAGQVLTGRPHLLSEGEDGLVEIFLDCAPYSVEAYGTKLAFAWMLQSHQKSVCEVLSCDNGTRFTPKEVDGQWLLAMRRAIAMIDVALPSATISAFADRACRSLVG